MELVSVLNEILHEKYLAWYLTYTKCKKKKNFFSNWEVIYLVQSMAIIKVCGLFPWLSFLPMWASVEFSSGSSAESRARYSPRRTYLLDVAVPIWAILLPSVPSRREMWTVPITAHLIFALLTAAVWGPYISSDLPLLYSATPQKLCSVNGEHRRVIRKSRWKRSTSSRLTRGPVSRNSFSWAVSCPLNQRISALDKTLEVVEAQLLPSSQILLATPPSDGFSRSSVLELPPVTASSLTVSVVHFIVQTEICPLCMYSRRNKGEGYCVGHGSVQKTGSSLSGCCNQRGI